MKKIAILVCLTLLVSLFAVNVGAYGETVTSTVDFRTLTPADAGDASKASMESLGVTIPEDSGAWWLQDCYHVFATPQDGYKTCSFIQTLEAGEGKVFAADVSLTAGYWLAAVGDPSWFWVEISTDGVNWTEAYADETGRGNEWEASAYAEGTLPLAGTAGASKIYVKFNVERHSGQTSGGVSFSTLSASVKRVNEVVNAVDFRTLTPADAGDASKAAMESLGITIPEDSNPWWVQDCFHVFATPQDGYKTCSYIQTLAAGEGKVFAGDVNLTAGYWLAAVGDPSWFWVEISTDGETWTEIFTDEAGRGAEWDASAYGEGTISLPGTADAAVVYVKFNVERHSGQTAGGITFSTLFADTKDAPAEEPAESKTLSIGDKVITAEGGKWLYNTEVTKETTSGYTMIVFDKNYAGTFETNGYGVALVLDQYGALVRVYDGANVGFWTAEGKAASAHFNANTYATTAWAELQDGETLIIIPNDGGSNDARKIALSMRGDCGKAAALEGFTFETAPEEPTPTEPQPTEPAPTEPVEPGAPDTGDIFGIVVALMAVSGMALVVLKKKF